MERIEVLDLVKVAFETRKDPEKRGKSIEAIRDKIVAEDDVIPGAHLHILARAALDLARMGTDSKIVQECQLLEEKYLLRLLGEYMEGDVEKTQDLYSLILITRESCAKGDLARIKDCMKKIDENISFDSDVPEFVKSLLYSVRKMCEAKL